MLDKLTINLLVIFRVNLEELVPIVNSNRSKGTIVLISQYYG